MDRLIATKFLISVPATRSMPSICTRLSGSIRATSSYDRDVLDGAGYWIGGIESFRRICGR